jgi:hypothetical protein
MENGGGMDLTTGQAWPLLDERRRVQAILVAVELVALAAPVALWSPLSRADLGLALVLGSLSVTYSLFVVSWERARRHLLFELTPAMTPNLLATWCFAAALLLPPTLAAAVTMVACAGGWRVYNAAGSPLLYKYFYSAMTAVLAATAASAAFHLHTLPPMAALLVSAGAWLAVSVGAVMLAMLASGQFEAIKQVAHPKTHALEVLTMGLAVGEYGLKQACLLPLIWLSLPAAVLVLRRVTQAQLQSRDASARPMDEQAWLMVARVVVEASVTASVLRIDTADAQLARTVAMMQGGCDAIGTCADGGLAILLTDCPPAQGDALARRLRTAMDYHKVACNIVSVSKPRDGQALEDLLAVAEAELVVSAVEVPRRSASSR